MSKQPKSILVVGYGQAGKSLARSLKNTGQELKGFLDDKSQAKPVLGKLADVNRVVSNYKITDV